MASYKVSKVILSLRNASVPWSKVLNNAQLNVLFQPNLEQLISAQEKTVWK